MLHKSFKPAKCKTSLKLAVSRIKLLRNRRGEQVKKMKRELAQLLESGQDQTARIRVEHVIREEKTLAAYDLIELYCELIVARLPIIESQKSCPIDLKEAISTVVFASPRCADVPELLDIRKHFAAKYGKDFINSSLEVRPDCGVSRLVVEKLSARAPDVETKLNFLKSISEEHNVKWEPKAFEEQHQKPHEDLLNGATAFSATSKISIESSNTEPSSAPTLINESSMKRAPNSSASRPTSSSNSSQTNNRTPDTTVPFNTQSGLRSSENRFGSVETKNSHSRENVPFNRPNWTMEFQDATSAAQAAAESAERASMAARAAAELASREHMSRQNSTGSNGSPSDNRKYERPERLRGLLGDDFIEESVARPVDLRRLQEMKTEEQNLQVNERMEEPSRREAGWTANDNLAATKQPSRSSSHSSQAPSRSLSSSSQSYVDDDNLDVSLHRDNVTGYDHSRSEDGKQIPSNQAYMDFTSNQSSYSQYSSGLDEKSSNFNIHEGENYEGETSRTSAAESFGGSNRKLSNSGDYSAVVFDDYSSDTEDGNLSFGGNKGNLLDSYQGEEPSHFQSNIGVFSVDQDRSTFLASNSGAKLHLFKDEEHSGTEVTVPAASFDNVPATFDDSDGENIENEEVTDSTHNELRPVNFLDNQRSMRNSFSDDSIHGSNIRYTGVEESIKETIPTSEGNEEEIEKRNTNDLVIGADYSSSDEDDLQPLHSIKRPSMRETDGKEKFETLPGPLGAGDSLILNNLSSPSEQRLNFSNLTGGFKHRGFPQPPYVRRSSNVDSSHSAKQTSVETSFIEKPITSQLDKSASSFEVANEERQSRSSPDSVKEFVSYHSTEGTSEIVERLSVPRKDKFTEVDLSRESINQRSQGKGQKEVNSSSSRTNYDLDGSEQGYAGKGYRDSVVPQLKQSSYPYSDSDKLTPTKSNKSMTTKSEILDGYTYDQEPRTMEPKVSSSRLNILDSDGSEENLDSTYSVGNRVNAGVKHSRRTRNMPSEDRRSSSKVLGISSVKSPFRKENQPSRDSLPASESLSNTYIQDGSYKSLRSNPLVREHSAHDESPNSSQLNPTNFVAPLNNLKSKPSGTSGDSSSRESSIKKASHTHPKLPDYESLAAHFHSLRSNQR